MKNLLKIFSFFYIFLCISFDVNSQVSSRNGYWLPVHDTTKILLVYAEDTSISSDTGTTQWPLGELPINPDKYLSHEITNPATLGYISRYFYLASFGKYIVLGDYMDTIVSVSSSNNDNVVINFINNLPGSDIFTKNGLSLHSDDFDQWEHSPTVRSALATDYFIKTAIIKNCISCRSIPTRSLVKDSIN
ncbi:MAG: hypothetical protein EA412_06335 [Chitinophagaceae bacterium]|nr:MAG: hypothetical protein EA412_06335 [Chitinophagaceae bacterium]